MGTKDVRVDWRALKDFSREVFARAGFAPEGAELQADVLVWANLRGVDSHGVHQAQEERRSDVIAAPWCA